MNAPFPWHGALWAQWSRAYQSGRLGHAWLFSGRAGFGKLEFARSCGELLLCEAPAKQGLACGQCRSCLLLQAGNHPDLRFVAPLEDASSISIDQIRELGDFFSLTSHYGQAKVVIIRPADLMNRAAANALLKILEEPPARGILLLVANAIDRLTPTIRSRCQRLRLDAIETSAGLQWLTEQINEPPEAVAAAFTLANRAPLAARTALSDGLADAATRVEQQLLAVGSGRMHAVQASQMLEDIDPIVLADLMLMQAHRFALARIGVGASPAGVTPNPGPSSSASLLASLDHLHSSQVLAFTSTILEVKALMVSATSYRSGDLIDQLWRAWMQATRPAASSVRAKT